MGRQAGTAARFRLPACLPYTHERRHMQLPWSACNRCAVSLWSFVLAYAGLEEVLPAVQHHMAISRLPYAEREAMLKVFMLSAP